MRIPQGSLKPAFEMLVKDGGAVPPDLDLLPADAFVIVGVQGVAELFRAQADAVDATAGKLTHEWVGPVGDTPGETDVRGRIFVHAEVDFGDGKPVTFPQYGELAVDVD